MDNPENAWTRPKNVPYPSIWTRFEGKKPINGKIPKFWVQDIPEEEFEVMAQIMLSNFTNEEPLTKYSDLKNDEQSANDLLQIWRNILKNKLGLVCYMENPDPNGKPIVAGLNCTCISSKYQKSNYETKGESVKEVFEVVHYLERQKDPFEILGTDHLLFALGLYVMPEFRGQGLGARILEAREPLCKAVGLKGTITAFTATVSQLLAERVGFKVMAEASYEEIMRSNPSLQFPGIEKDTEMVKYMYKMYT